MKYDLHWVGRVLYLFSERLKEQYCCRQLHVEVSWGLKVTDCAIPYLMALPAHLTLIIMYCTSPDFGHAGSLEPQVQAGKLMLGG